MALLSNVLSCMYMKSCCFTLFVFHLQWYRPPLITDLTIPLVDYGCNSEEKNKQKERQQKVLQAIYFSPEM